MIIEPLRRFSQNGIDFIPGRQIEVESLSVNREYYKIISMKPVVKPVVDQRLDRPRKRTVNTSMKRNQVNKVVIEK